MSTGAILNRLHSNRQRQRTLIFFSVASCVAVVVFIVALERRGSTPPPPPPTPVVDANRHVPVRPPLRSHATPQPLPIPPEPPPEPEPPPAVASSVRAHISCSHGWGLWIDQRKFGTCKTFDLDLTPGPHVIMGRRGRHVVQETVTIDSAVSIKIDGSKRKISVQKLK